MKHIIGVARLQNPILCKEDLLGKEFEVSVDSSIFKLIFPCILNNIEGEDNLDVPEKYKIPNIAEFGFVKSRSLDGEVLGILVNSILVSFECKMENSPLRYEDKTYSIDKIISRLDEILTIFGKFRNSNETNMTTRSDFELFDVDSQVRISRNLELNLNFDLSLEDCISYEEFNCILSGISFEKRLRVEYQLLCRSNIEFRNENYKYALFEAFTSCELAIGEYILHRIASGVSEPDEFEKTKYFSSKLHLLERAGKLHNTTLKSEIIYLRNKLYHAEKIDLDRIKCERIINYVKEIIDELLPGMYE